MCGRTLRAPTCRGAPIPPISRYTRTQGQSKSGWLLGRSHDLVEALLPSKCSLDACGVVATLAASSTRRTIERTILALLEASHSRRAVMNWKTAVAAGVLLVGLACRDATRPVQDV